MEFKYKAFISYRHVERDAAAAKAIHTAVERYVIPKKLRKDGKKHPGRVFRDEEELSISEDLSEDICEALDQSEFLIVVCSPDTLDSKWVPREIAYFRDHRDPENILTVLTGGDPGEIFRTLMPGMPEPLFLDLSGSPTRAIARELKEQFLKLCAPLLGCRYDDLVRRDEKRRRRQMMWWSAGIAAVAAVIIGILMWSNWQIEGKNEELAQANSELAQKNDELAQRNDEILLHVSERLTLEAQQALEESDKPTAVRNALAALPSAELDRPYYAPAEQLLWDVLDPLHVNKDTMIPRNTVLEQETPVEEFCISGDGRLLTTIDPYGTLTCFDTATGEQIWTSKLTADSNYSSAAIYPCTVWNSIIVTCGQTAYGISQETGEVLWTNGNAYYGDHFEMSDDGRYLACMVRENLSSSVSLSCISTQDGTTLNVFPLAESDHYHLFGRNTCDFSADGNLFAGCYGVTLSDQSYELIYFLTDLTTGTTETILRQKVTDIYKIVYKLSFSDGDTTLTVIRDSGDFDIAAIVEKVSIPDRSLIWQITTPREEDRMFSFSYMDTYYLADCGSYHLLGVHDMLYVLDRNTGEFMLSRILDSEIRTLEAINSDSFALVLEDGTYSCGWCTSSRLALMNDFFSVFSSVPTDLGPIQRANLWNGGYMYARFDNGISLYYGPESEGFGYAVVIPQDNDCSVIIKRIMPFIADLDTRTALTTDSSEEIVLDSVSICSSDTISVQCSSETAEGGERHRFFLLDRATLEVTDSFAVDLGLNSYHNTFVLPDGSGLIYQDSGSELCFFDRKTQTSTVLVPDFNVDIPFLIDGKEIKTDRLKTKSFRSSADHSVWTILTTDHGIKYWINGQAQPDVPWPDIWGWLGSVNMYDADFQLGCGSYILVDPPPYSETAEYNNYSFYSTDEEKWYQIPCGENDLTHHIACMGVTSPIFTVMDSSGVIRTYDIPTGRQTMEIATRLSPNSVSQLKWILNDRYLTIFTEDKLLCIIDGTTAETVYQQSMADYYFWDPPSFAADPKGERLYIWETEGLCVDTRSWSTLFDIPDIDLYDPVSDRILYIDSILEEDSYIDTLQSYRLPTTEELVEMGRQFLGE